MSTKKRVFTPSQCKAISHTGSDLLISAGAGSGKTATLTQRIIEKILLGADITKMLVVTFTKEAANELKSRITIAIANELKSNPKNEHLRAQIVKMSSADISTIHSFCLRVIRPNFDKINVDSDVRVGEESEIETIKKETMSDVISSFYESGEPDKDFLIVSDCYSQLSREDALDEKLLILYNKLSSTSLFLDTLLISQNHTGDFMQSSYGQILADEIRRFVDYFTPIYEKIIDDIMRLDGTPKYLRAFASDLDILKRLENALISPSYSTLKGIFDSYEPIGINGIKDTATNGDFAKAIRSEFKDTIRDHYKKMLFVSSEESINASFEQNSIICRAMYKVLKRFDEEFAANKRKYGLCDFNDLERLSYKLLVNQDGTPSDIAKKISNQYDEIYIDEFQDTNSVQDAIFSSISKNNRFMVGDIKQSIYKFRSAEPEIFSKYRTSFENITFENSDTCGGKTIFMSENFRCDKSVIDFTNLVSDYMFFNSSGIPYQKEDNLIYKKQNDGDYVSVPCEVKLLDRALIDKENGEHHEVLQAKYVAKRIHEMINKQKLPNGKVIKPKDIAILLRKGKHKSYYIKALNELGIASEFIDDVKFFEKPHILLLLSILNVIDNPHKDVYLAGALHSPIFNFTLDELIKIRRASKNSASLYSALLNFSGDLEIEQKRLEFIERIEKMRKEASTMNAYDAVSYVMRESGLISMSNGAQRKDLIKFYNRAREYEKNSFKGLYKFLLYIESIKSSSSKETLFTNPDECVRIMSIHASKGLEFEICFLCNTETGFSTQDTKEPILFERRLGIASFVGNYDSLIKYNTLLRKCLSISIDKANKDEEMRVLYVAMTRARSRLIITASSKDAQKQLNLVNDLSPWTQENYIYSRRSHIDFILNAIDRPTEYVDFDIIDPNTLCDIGNGVDSKTSEPSKEEVAFARDVLRKRFDYKYEFEYLNKIPSKLSVSKLKPNLLDDEDNDEIDIKKPLAQMPLFLSNKTSEATASAKGTATHVFMQFCDFKKLHENGYDSELARLVESSFISQSDAELINSEHIKSFIKSDLLAKMINSKMIYREFRFNVMLPATNLSQDERVNKEKVLVQGVIDAVFENEDGELVLVDYKTDNVTEENYIAELTRKHKTQLEYYKQAIELMFERKVSKTLIYSVPLAKTVEL